MNYLKLLWNSLAYKSPLPRKRLIKLLNSPSNGDFYEFMEDIDWLYPKICMRYVDALLWRVCQFWSWTCCITT